MLDERARPLEGAAVSLLSSGETVATSTSAADGGFTFADVPQGNGYTVVAVMDGRESEQRTGLEVTPGGLVDVGALLLASVSPEVVQLHTFDALPTGPLANGTDGWEVTSTGNAVDVVSVPSETDKSVRVTRTTNTGGTAGTNITQRFPDGLAGLVTIEARVMRDDPYVSGTTGSACRTSTTRQVPPLSVSPSTRGGSSRTKVRPRETSARTSSAGRTRSVSRSTR